MNSLLSRMVDRLVDVQFKTIPSGRLVFIPFTRKGKCYFIDSKAEEEKLRAFVKMYRIPVVGQFQFPQTGKLPSLVGNLGREEKAKTEGRMASHRDARGSAGKRLT
jgi:hypothetical protein